MNVKIKVIDRTSGQNETKYIYICSYSDFVIKDMCQVMIVKNINMSHSNYQNLVKCFFTKFENYYPNNFSYHLIQILIYESS